MRCPAGVIGVNRSWIRTGRRVRNQSSSRRVLERPTKVGDSPVDKRAEARWVCFLSTTGHEKPCGKLGGPPSKAKHGLMTDSAPVPRGKGEKNPGEGSEIEPETVCLQAVGALYRGSRVTGCVTACLLLNEPASSFMQQG